MNTSTSEYSSGCESGWTTYFDQISNYSDPYTNNNYQQKAAGIHHINYADHHHQQQQDQDQNQEEEEDLSMLSDASSAPPNSTYYYSQHKNKNNNNKNKKKSSYNIKEHNLCLDDTATSSILHFSQGESVTKNKRLGFFKSSTKEKSGNVVGRKRQ